MRVRLTALAAVLALGAAFGLAGASAAIPAEARKQPAQHLIGVRVVNGASELYRRGTGKRFVPRGANYLKLDPRPGQDSFDLLLDPRAFDAGTIRRDLAELRKLGYNTIRVFLDLCRFECIGSRERLNPELLDNLATLLRIAKQQKLFVMPTVNEIDAFFSYRAELPRCCELYDGSFNALFLTSEGIKAAHAFYTDVITGLQKRGAPLEAILAWELRNELSFNSHLPPFSLESGTVTTANGETYDLSSAADKTRMADEGIIHFVDRLRRTIRALDPGALVTVGFFPPHVEDQRLVPAGALARSAVDFLDIHIYPPVNVPIAFEAEIEALGLADYDAKPVVLGEFGAFKWTAPTPRAAARLLADWQVESCRYGIDGWLHWPYGAASDPELWTGADGDSAINRVLSPKDRPAPCALGGSYEPNLTGGQPATASASLEGSGPDQAVDTLRGTEWNAGGPPPHWIEVDLGAPATVSEIDLLTSQLVEGQTRHRIWGRRADDSLVLLADLLENTSDNQWLVAGGPWEGLTAVRVETVSGPAGVAWREIQVLGSIEAGSRIAT